MQNPSAAREVRVVCRELPDTVRGFVFRRGDGYCVVLNAGISPAMRRRTLAHELLHIARGDDASPLPVREIERRMDAVTPSFPWA